MTSSLKKQMKTTCQENLVFCLCEEEHPVH